MTAEVSGAPSAPDLEVRIGSESHVLTSDGGAAVVGRDPSATVRINDERISRSHLRLEPRDDCWQAVDTSTNGVFVAGVRRDEFPITEPTVVHLGDAEGIPLRLEPSRFSEADDVDHPSESDPDLARAGRAVAARRRELDITQRSLARDKVINAGTLIAFEKGRSWPRRGTLAKLEQVLNWPAGTIARIRNGSTGAQVGDGTEILTDTVQAPLMAEAVELAMRTIGDAVDVLPDPADPNFTASAAPILANLRKLEAVAANAARSARGTPAVVLALSAVRRSYNRLMLQAARSPSASLGQRLYGARHRAELSIEEAANAAGVPAEDVTTAEAEGSVPPDSVAALNALIAQLGVH